MPPCHIQSSSSNLRYFANRVHVKNRFSFNGLCVYILLCFLLLAQAIPLRTRGELRVDGTLGVKKDYSLVGFTFVHTG